ncbi:MAG: TonB-dependent receptor [Verrucomicrobia bacterium]|nr:TonB-dependent receptor [Verrucomicrobiota bacterium]
MPSDELLTPNLKALTINLDEPRYGTFAEIGAGQEVARHFFQAGGAAGTMAKSISAYDLKFGDAIYGTAARHVSPEWLHAMLDHEYDLLIERLKELRGDRSAFFVFADTVSAGGQEDADDRHGWMGIRFQDAPNTTPSDIILHLRMWDKEHILQQQALGIVGVNLIYGAFYYLNDQDRFIRSLADNLGIDRIEVDMVTFSGPLFAQVDNRLMSLKLVEYGLTNAVMFSPQGMVLQPSEVLHDKAILVEPGSFRPVTLVNEDMLRCALAQFLQEPAVQGIDVVVLLEITLENLRAAGNLDASHFLARVDTLAALGNNVLISSYQEFYRLTSYFRRYTKQMVGVAMGINTLLEVFNESHYENLEGGILESFGRLFRNATKLYIYPMRKAAFDRYCKKPAGTIPDAATPVRPRSTLPVDVYINANNLQVTTHLRNLYAHLLESHYIEALVGYNPAILDIFSRDVLAKIQGGDNSWENMVPTKAAELIKQRGLFGYRPLANPESQPVPEAPVAAS